MLYLDLLIEQQRWRWKQWPQREGSAWSPRGCDSESEGNNLVSQIYGFGSDAFLGPNSLHNSSPSLILQTTISMVVWKFLRDQPLCAQRKGLSPDDDGALRSVLQDLQELCRPTSDPKTYSGKSWMYSHHTCPLTFPGPYGIR